MEQYVVFGPMYICGACFCLLILAFLVLVVFLVLKGRNQAWTGVVLDKNHNTKDGDNGTEHFYSFKVKFNDGRIGNIAAASEFYDTVKVGDKLKKAKGEIYPEKIS